MASTQKIIVSSTTHALISAQSSGNTGAVDKEIVEMSDIGGTNDTSVVAIEYIEYSLIPNKQLLIEFSKADADSSSNDDTIYEVYGQGKFGSPERRISKDLNASAAFNRIKFKFAQDCAGSCLILLRKVSGF